MENKNRAKSVNIKVVILMHSISNIILIRLVMLYKDSYSLMEVQVASTDTWKKALPLFLWRESPPIRRKRYLLRCASLKIFAKRCAQNSCIFDLFTADFLTCNQSDDNIMKRGKPAGDNTIETKHN